MEIFGYLAAILIGVSLGLVGSGGSILTVPVLVYLIGLNPVLATAYSLFIVGSTALVGSINFARKKLVSFKTAIVFGLPAMVAVFATRKYLIPAIPDEIFTLNGFVLTKGNFLLILFAILMIIAAYSMIRNNGKKDIDTEEQEQKFNYPVIVLEGLFVGVLTGLVGAGGGFLIIPALVLLSKLDMRKAVGTSLLIIAAKSLFGFIGDLFNLEIDWFFLLTFTATSVAGIFVGQWLSKKITAGNLKKGFGWFVLIMGIYILLRESVFK